MNPNIPPAGSGQISLTNTSPIMCAEPNCGGNFFIPAVSFRKVSRLLTGGPKDAVIPVEVYLCCNCHTPLDELLPEPLKQKKIKLD